MFKSTFLILFCERLMFVKVFFVCQNAANAYLFPNVVFGHAKTFTLKFTWISENLNCLFCRGLRKDIFFRKKFLLSCLPIERSLGFENRIWVLLDCLSEFYCNSVFEKDASRCQRTKISEKIWVLDSCKFCWIVFKEGFGFIQTC